MKDSIVDIDKSLHKILEAINDAPAGIAFLVNDQNQLKGVITDGDVRRLLLKGRDIKDPIVPSDYGDFVYATEGESIHDLMNKTTKKARVIPIIDSEGRPVDYFRYEHKTHFTPVAEPSLKGRELDYVTDAVLSTWISSSGKYIERFEKEFSVFSEAEYGVAVSNGTVALHLALKTLGVEPGDEVIIPDLTFAATANAVIHSGATPVIVDIEEQSWCIDTSAIEKAITAETKVIMPVHVYGQPCDMPAIMALAEKHDLYVVEDAAEAHGASVNNKKVGSWGDIACFSFFANKIITTGEGGMCLTSSKKLNERMRKLRDHGMNKEKKYWHDEVGFNYRMTNLQAAIGCAQMERIDDILQERKNLEKKYMTMLSDCFDWPLDMEKRERVIWLIAAQCKIDREKLIENARSKQIDIRPFFYPLTAMPIYRDYALADNPVAQKISERGVNLPTVDNVDIEALKKICDGI